MRGRPVPGALTYTFIEGFILQSMIQGTGLAMLAHRRRTERSAAIYGIPAGDAATAITGA